jgi:hypothetical protein
MPLAGRGFGAEVRRAMDARADHLVGEGLARRFRDSGLIFSADLLDTLRKRELDAVGAKPRRRDRACTCPAASGENVAGVFASV